MKALEYSIPTKSQIPSGNLPFPAKESYSSGWFYMTAIGCIGPLMIHVVDSEKFGPKLGDVAIGEYGPAIVPEGIRLSQFSPLGRIVGRKNVNEYADHLLVERLPTQEQRVIEEKLDDLNQDDVLQWGKDIWPRHK